MAFCPGTVAHANAVCADAAVTYSDDVFAAATISYPDDSVVPQTFAVPGFNDLGAATAAPPEPPCPPPLPPGVPSSKPSFSFGELVATTELDNGLRAETWQLRNEHAALLEQQQKEWAGSKSLHRCFPRTNLTRDCDAAGTCALHATCCVSVADSAGWSVVITVCSACCVVC